MLSKIKNFIRGIKNLIKYSKTIYNDRDWDHMFVFDLLYKKIKSMEYNFDNVYDMSIKNKEKAKEIKIAKLLLERIVNRDYVDNALIPYYKKYGNDLEFCTVKDQKSGFYRIIDTSTKQQSKLKRKCCEHSDYMKKQDIDYLFSFLSKHITDWWD